MNKVILMGRLTKEPEMSYTQSSNTAVCKFTLAVDRRFKKDETDFIPIVTWRKTAEFASKYFGKGQKVCVVGELQVRQWEDKDGHKRYTTEVIADECYFAESKKTSSEYGSQVSKQTDDSMGKDYLLPDDFDEDGLPF